MADKSNKVDCFKCAHFAVTWEPGRSKACRFFGFKTDRIPSIAVLESSGKQCEAFLPKKR